MISRRVFVVGAAGAMTSSACSGDAAMPADATALRSGKRAGRFDWSDGDMRAAVAGDPENGIYVPPDSDLSGASGAWVRRVSGPLRPEWFGAAGDGVTDDTSAFAGLATYVNGVGGGEIAFAKANYRVGRQRLAQPGGRYLFEPHPILVFVGCSRGVRIHGNDARLYCAPGLRFGTFARGGARATRNVQPFYGDGETATPYVAMLSFTDCAGPIHVSGLELDGNLDSLIVGGGWGDVGWQIPACGILLTNNRGDEILEDIHSHHHALDGLMIDGDDDASLARRVTRRVVRLRADGNGRQGCSLVGGRRYTFIGCRFSRTGKAGLSSPPAAGLDIEAEGDKVVRDISFEDCDFVDNSGCGLLADSGDGADATFTRCRFAGTTSWSAWPKKPGFAFDHCDFVGAIVNCHGDDIPARATRFTDCRFLDDPGLAPHRTVFLGGGRTGPVADLSSTRNVRFERCAFALEHDGILPWSVHAIYADCDMRQRQPAPAYPRGTFLGRTRIVGNVHLEASRIQGDVILNGRAVRR